MESWSLSIYMYLVAHYSGVDVVLRVVAEFYLLMGSCRCFKVHGHLHVPGSSHSVVGLVSGHLHVLVVWAAVPGKPSLSWAPAFYSWRSFAHLTLDQAHLLRTACVELEDHAGLFTCSSEAKKAQRVSRATLESVNVVLCTNNSGV